MGDVACRCSCNVYRTLVVKPEGMRPLGRRRCGWENNKLDHKKTEYKGVVYIHLAQVRIQWHAVVKMVKK